MSNIDQIKKELIALKKEQHDQEEASVIINTLKRLLDIERKHLFSGVRGKQDMLEKTVVSALKKYQEEKDCAVKKS